MRYMSVCSGVEAASLAWRGLGWRDRTGRLHCQYVEEMS